VRNQNPEVMGKIKLQPFCGEGIDAEWIRLKIQAIAGPGVTKVHTIDCAMVPKLNEQFMITADVMTQLARDVSEALIASNVTVDDNNDNDDVGDITVSNDDDDNDVLYQHNENADIVDEVSSNCVPDESFVKSEASCQKVAQKQREDETLNGCFKLAKEGKGGFIIMDDLLYHKKSVMGQIIFQLVVPQPRRKHVLDLGHNNYGGHMAERNTRERHYVLLADHTV